MGKQRGKCNKSPPYLVHEVFVLAGVRAGVVNTGAPEVVQLDLAPALVRYLQPQLLPLGVAHLDAMVHGDLCV
jgi:hypothetical protein